MKNNHILKATAFVLAAAFVWTSSSITAQNIKEKDIAYDTPRKTQPVVAEIVPEEERWSVEQQLTYASRGEDDTELILICDGLIDELNEAKEKMEADTADLEQWADPEIVGRQKEYEAKFNAKYEDTVQALNNVKDGVDTEENIGIIADNLSSGKKTPSTYAASAASVQPAAVEYTEDREVRAAKEVSYEPTEDDLNCEKDIVDKEAFSKIAEELGDVDDIYHFVRNNVKNEMYTGSKKGPLLTFFQLGGNDIDQASLLISLLRVKNIPARFVRGTVRITIQQGLELTGASDPDTASRILAQSYRNSKNVVDQSGSLTAFMFDHTWVEAYIPYTDYRGAGNKSGDSVWIQLDPGFKKLINVSDEIEATYTEDQLASLGEMSRIISESPELYGEDAETPEKIDLHFSDIEDKNELYIPSSLPYQVKDIAERYDFIKDSDKQTISLSVDGERLFSSPVAELYGRSINISYEPASDKDRETMEHYEKITDVPAQAVRVIPVVTVGDKKYSSKELSCSLGTQQQLYTTIKDDTGTTSLNDILLSGSVYAITLDLNIISSVESEIAEAGMKAANEKRGTDEFFSAEVLGQVLSYAGKYYFTLCDENNQFQASVDNVNYSRHIAAAITGYQFQTTENFIGMTNSLETGNFYIDAEYNKSSAVSLDGDTNAERQYNFETGIIESRYEGEVWADITGTDKPCISTMHVMEAALKNDIEPVYLVKQNANEILADCHIDNYIKNNVMSCVNSGDIVILIPEILTIGDWTGTAYIDLDPVTAAGVYMISDGTAGGASPTFEFLEDLSADDLFTMNIKLSYMSRALAVIGAYKACSTITAAAESGNLKKAVSQLKAGVGSAFAYCNAVQMELNMCDVVLDYADGKYNEDELKDKLESEADENLKTVIKQMISLVNTSPLLSQLMALENLLDVQSPSPEDDDVARLKRKWKIFSNVTTFFQLF